MHRPTLFTLAVLICGLAYQPVQAEVTKPEIVPRDAWEKVKPRVDVMVEQKTPYKGIVVHHTVVPHESKAWANKKIADVMRDIQRDHMKKTQSFRPGLKGKPWADFAYHYLINIDGQIAEGRDTKYEGDSGTNYNMAGLLLVVLQGDFTKDRPTKAQLKSLDQLTAWLAKTHKIKGDRITAHNDHTDTKCPGPYLKAYVPELKRKTIAALK